MIAASDTAYLQTVIDRAAATAPGAAVIDGGLAQSLGQGAAGVALLHVERAVRGTGSWANAHAWISATATGPISTAPQAGLFTGAPAVAFLLAAADAHSGRFTAHTDNLLASITATTHQRVEAAFDRIKAREPSQFTEYDLISGLTGVGRLLLHLRPDDDALARVLDYLVALTQPIRIDGRWRPGWWVDHDPDTILPTPGGHANYGLAHGIAGVLALLALAHRHGITVDGHTDAINRITGHLDGIACHGLHGTWWPQWKTSSGHHHSDAPPRPSWCYGTPGIARALQLAAIAVGDTSVQDDAETALADSLADPATADQLEDVGLCHGWAGAYVTAWHAARDSATGRLSGLLPALTERFARAATRHTGTDVSLLDGTTGVALAAQLAMTNAPSPIGWETCLLIA